jgi:hypothetical protein
MIFCIKNYHKNINSSLTAKSIKHFGDHKVYLINIHKHDIPDREGLDASLFDGIYDFKAKYNFGTGAGSQVNGFYFSEGINRAFECFKHTEEKIVVIDEDHFFTTGKQIQDLEENEYDLAWAYWTAPPPQSDIDVSGAIISFRPASIKNLFPLPERLQFIEHLLKQELLEKMPSNLKVYKMKYRDYTNYFGDGFFTNDWAEIDAELKKIGIIK